MLFIDPALFFQPTWEASHGLSGFITIFIQFPHSNSRHSCSINAKHFAGRIIHGALFRFQRTENGVSACSINRCSSEARVRRLGLHKTQIRCNSAPASWASRSIAPRPMHCLCTDHVHQQVHHTSGLDSAGWMKRNGSGDKQPGMMHRYAPVISKSSKKSIDAGQKAILYLNNCCC